MAGLCDLNCLNEAASCGGSSVVGIGWKFYPIQLYCLFLRVTGGADSNAGDGEQQARALVATLGAANNLRNTEQGKSQQYSGGRRDYSPIGSIFTS